MTVYRCEICKEDIPVTLDHPRGYVVQLWDAEAARDSRIPPPEMHYCNKCLKMVVGSTSRPSVCEFFWAIHACLRGALK